MFFKVAQKVNFYLGNFSEKIRYQEIRKAFKNRPIWPHSQIYLCCPHQEVQGRGGGDQFDQIGQFQKFVQRILLQKYPNYFCDFWGYFENIFSKVETAVSTFWFYF